MSKHFCMLAQPYDGARVKRWPVAVETKLDGFRLIVIIEPGVPGASPDVHFLSRSGKAFTSLEHLRAPLAQLCLSLSGARLVLDGEVTSGSFKDTSSSVRRKSVQATDAVFTVFDAYFKGGEVAPYTQRRTRARQWVASLNHPSFQLSLMTMADNESEVITCYQAARELGYEGIIIKDVNAPYEYKRSYAWMKIKGYESDDLEVIGAFEGEGKHVGRAGGIMCRIGDTVVRVGTGFTDAQRQEIWDESFLMAGRIAEVGYHEKTPDGSLRHPRFIRWRDTVHHGEKE